MISARATVVFALKHKETGEIHAHSVPFKEDFVSVTATLLVTLNEDTGTLDFTEMTLKIPGLGRVKSRKDLPGKAIVVDEEKEEGEEGEGEEGEGEPKQNEEGEDKEKK